MYRGPGPRGSRLEQHVRGARVLAVVIDSSHVRALSFKEGKVQQELGSGILCVESAFYLPPVPDKDASELFYLDLYFRNSPALHSTKSTVRFHTRLNSIHLIQDLKSNKKKTPEKRILQFSMLHLFQHFSPANPQDFSGIFQI